MIYLASNSPRRAELLEQIGVPFAVISTSIKEERGEGESAESYVLRLALEKAQAGFNKSEQRKAVLGADTIIVIDRQILEKPADQNDAKKMLRLLSGRTHQVFTAIAMVDGQLTKTQLVKTEVSFKELTELEIDDYWSTGEPKDKAAGYAIQGIAGKFVTNINGSYSAVVGLPLYETEQLIKEFEE
jgi:septum formation protein